MRVSVVFSCGPITPSLPVSVPSDVVVVWFAVARWSGAERFVAKAPTSTLMWWSVYHRRYWAEQSVRPASLTHPAKCQSSLHTDISKSFCHNFCCCQARKTTHNIKTWTELPVVESIRMTEDRDKWRKYVHSVANPRIKDG